MRVSNLQAMAYKNSQCRAAWSGHCLSAPTLAMTVKEGEGAYCVTAFWKAVQAWQMSCDSVNVSNNRPAARGRGQKNIILEVQNVERKPECNRLRSKWEGFIWKKFASRLRERTNDTVLSPNSVGLQLHEFVAFSAWIQSCCAIFSSHASTF